MPLFNLILKPVHRGKKLITPDQAETGQPNGVVQHFLNYVSNHNRGFFYKGIGSILSLNS